MDCHRQCRMPFEMAGSGCVLVAISKFIRHRAAGGWSGGRVHDAVHLRCAQDWSFYIVSGGSGVNQGLIGYFEAERSE